MSKTDSSGTSTYRRDGAGATSSVLFDGTATYVPGVSRHAGSGTRVYNPDFIGSNRVESDASGIAVATRVYDAYGNQTASTGSPSSPFGFAGAFGYQEDGDSGLKLLGHRMYDPTVGRFITRDPAQSGSNWYAYCENNPLKSVDSAGMWRLIIHGKHDGVPFAGIADWWQMPHAGKGDKEFQETASKADVLEAMIECDECYFFGHGTPDGSLEMDGYFITPEDLAYVARERNKRHKHKMSQAAAFSCWSANLGSTVNAWLQISSEFTGYPDVTGEIPPQNWPHLNPTQTFRTPIHYNPGPGRGSPTGSKKNQKKGGKGKRVRKGKKGKVWNAS